MPEKKPEKICYICGLQLEEYPYHPEFRTADIEFICPCCGTHYGLDDEGAGKVEVPDEIVNAYQSFGDEAHKKIIKILRQNWIEEGMNWWAVGDPFSPVPENWDPKKQLENVPIEFK
jgi:hypothetical protein